MLFLFFLLIRNRNSNDYFEGEEDISGYLNDFLLKIQYGGEFTFKQEKELEKLNIVVIGKTGVGKSTLIRHFFRDPSIVTGSGRPVTKTIYKVTNDTYPITIYDTPGFELNNKKQLLKDIMNLINDQFKTKDPSNYIHCIWYCVSSLSKRIEKSEVDIIKTISKKANIPIIIIVTQCYNDKDRDSMINNIKKEKLNVAGIVDLLATKKTIYNKKLHKKTTYPAYGLYDLVQVMDKNIPHILRRTLYNMNKASLCTKKWLSRASIGIMSGVSVGIGGNWIPYLKRYMLIPTNMIMMGSINYIYGVNISKDFMMHFLNTTIGQIEKFGDYFRLIKNERIDNKSYENENDDTNFENENDGTYFEDQEEEDTYSEDEFNQIAFEEENNDEEFDNKIDDDELWERIKDYLNNVKNNQAFIKSLPLIGPIAYKVFQFTEKACQNLFPRLVKIFKNSYECVKEYLPEMIKFFKNNKKNILIAIPSGAITAALGESYRSFVEEYYLNNHTVSEEEIDNHIQSLFKKAYSQQVANYR